MDFERFAPAKVNLFLHVGPKGDDGYHPICSLVTFADVGDRVRLRREEEMRFVVEGPFAEGLGGDDNLVVRARDALMAIAQEPLTPFRLTLEKQLPIASGLGGGSSDAAATLNLIAETFALAVGEVPDIPTVRRPDAATQLLRDVAWPLAGDPDRPLAAIAGRLGADVAACLDGVPVLAQGRGDQCDYPPVFPDLDVVLVNPGVPSLTARVYAAFDDAGGSAQADTPDWPDSMDTPEDLVAFLSQCRNDLEGPAISLQPAIGEVLEALRGRPETLFARMSGSGATCFAICADEGDRDELAQSLSAAHADWWVRPCRLAGFRP